MSAGTGEAHVLVLAGGLSYERDVSLRSGRRVLDALRAAGIEAVVRDVDPAEAEVPTVIFSAKDAE